MTFRLFQLSLLIALFSWHSVYSQQGAYAAIVSSSGEVTPVLFDIPSGFISSVDINSSGQGIIGGQDFSGSMPAFAAFVSSSRRIRSSVPIPSNWPGSGLGFLTK